MKKSILALALIASTGLLFSCSESETTEETTMETTVEASTEEAEPAAEVEEVAMSLEDKLKGTWTQTHQGCDAEGAGGTSSSANKEWNFDGENLSMGSVTHPYRIEDDKFLIGEGEGSAYEISKEMGDTVLFHAIKTD